MRTLIPRNLALCAMLFLAATAHPVHAAGTFQRYRMSVGEYTISSGGGGGNRLPPGGQGTIAGGGTPGGGGTSGGGHGGTSGGGSAGGSEGGGTLIPAFCVDKGTHAPHSDDDFQGIAGSAYVQRLEAGRVIETRSLHDAVLGAIPWIKINGNGSATGVIVQPLIPGEFKLIVPDTTIVGPDEKGSASTLAAWNSKTDFKSASDKLDRIERELITTFGTDSALLAEWRLQRQVWQWGLLGASADPEAIRALHVAKDPTAQLISASAGVNPQAKASSDTPLIQFFGLALLEPKLLENPADRNSTAALLQGMGLLGSIPSESDIQAIRDEVGLLTHSGDHEDASGRVRLQREIMGSLGKYRQMNMSLPNAVVSANYDLLPEYVWTTGEFPDPNPPVLEALIAAFNARTAPGNSLRAALLKARFGSVTAAQSDRIVSVRSDIEGNLLLRAENDDSTESFSSKEITDSLVSKLAGTARPLVLTYDEESEKVLTKHGIPNERVEDYRNAKQAQMFIPSHKTLADGSAELTLRHALRKEDDAGLDVTFLKLASRGDSIVVKAPDGSVMLIDTGLTKDLVDILKVHFGGSIPPLRILITHTDADHIRGLKSIIQDGNISIREVLVGRYSGEPTKTAADILASLQRLSTGLVPSGESTGGVLHYIHPEEASPMFSVDFAQDGGVERWTLRALDQLQVVVYHMVDASAPNDGGLAVRLKYRGMSELLTDDLSPKALAALVDSEYASELQSGLLKWPHHVWFPPQKSKARETLEDFLLLVSPHTIVFTNTGDPSHPGNWDGVQRFIDKVLGKGVARHWTLEGPSGGHIRILTDLLVHGGSPLPC
jgi:beta-lactamase superfamily II metal-dependent hydrolase